MRILVTGREGQVVRSLIERAPPRGIDVLTLGRPELDLAGSVDAIIAAVEAADPDAIVSAAAYTQVDKAESEPELAFVRLLHWRESLQAVIERLVSPVRKEP